MLAVGFILSDVVRIPSRQRAPHSFRLFETSVLTRKNSWKFVSCRSNARGLFAIDINTSAFLNIHSSLSRHIAKLQHRFLGPIPSNLQQPQFTRFPDPLYKHVLESPRGVHYILAVARDESIFLPHLEPPNSQGVELLSQPGFSESRSEPRKFHSLFLRGSILRQTDLPWLRVNSSRAPPLPLLIPRVRI